MDVSRWSHRQTTRRSARKAAQEALGNRDYQRRLDRAQNVEGSCALALVFVFIRMRGWL